MIGDVFIQDGPRGLRFAAPTRMMIAMRPDEVIPALQAVKEVFPDSELNAIRAAREEEL